MSSFQDSLRRAKSRLAEMSINEVSLVDAAANRRTLVVIKDVNGMSTNTKKQTLKLPTDAKQGLMDGIGQALDKLTALGALVGDAEADDAASVPEELSTALKQMADMLTGMSTQYSGAPAPAGAEGAPPPDAQATPAAGAPDATAGKSANTPAEKALPSEVHDGDSLKTLLHDGDSLKTLMQKTVGAAHIELAALARLDKAGRKMAGARYKKLSELHDNLGKLLNELAYDEAAEASAGAAGAEKAKPKDDAKAEKEKDAKEPAKKSAEEPSGVVAEATALMKDLRTLIDSHGKRIDSIQETVSAVSKAHGVSNGGTVDGPTDVPVEKNDKVTWPLDMSADRVNKRAKANGATR